MGLKWDTEAGVLTIKIICVSDLQLLHLQPPLQDNGMYEQKKRKSRVERMQYTCII